MAIPRMRLLRHMVLELADSHGYPMCPGLPGRCLQDALPKTMYYMADQEMHRATTEPCLLTALYGINHRRIKGPLANQKEHRLNLISPCRDHRLHSRP